MVYTKGGSSATFPYADGAGTDVAPEASAPWWKPGGKSIVDKLNAYVTANPTVGGISLLKWKAGDSAAKPTVFDKTTP